MLSIFLLLIPNFLFAANDVYVLDITGSLTHIDLETGTVHEDVATLGSCPNEILYHDGYVYVVNSSSNSKALQKINVETWNVEDLAIGSGYNCWDVEMLSPETLLVSATMNNSLVLVSTNPLSVLGEIPGTGPCPEWMCCADDILYSACGGWGTDNNLVLVDLVTLAVEDTIQVETNCQSVVFDGVDEVFSINSGIYGNDEGSVSVVDISTGTVIDVLSVGGFPGTGIVRGNRVYAGDAWGPGVYVVTTDTHTVLHDSNNPIFPGGAGFATGNNGHLFVSDYLSGQMCVYDAGDVCAASFAVSNPGAIAVRGGYTGIQESENPIGIVNLSVTPCPACMVAVVNGALPGEVVSIFDLTGRIFTHSVADIEGKVTFNAASMPAGIYTVKSGELTARFTVLH